MKHIRCVSHIRRADTEDVDDILNAITVLLSVLGQLVPMLGGLIPPSGSGGSGGSLAKIGDKISA